MIKGGNTLSCEVYCICTVYLLGRDVDDRSPQVDFGIVLNAGQDEENACTQFTGGQVKGRRSFSEVFDNRIWTIHRRQFNEDDR